MLGITSIRSSIQNFTDKEKGVRKIATPGGFHIYITLM